ncbi:hypothetical protein ACFXAZ_02530 [Streptomyces sp. NPDC059477]|uniref:hypothetical protein n=1 Tax=Streptomyces sp. NPDC059477 TaxID=3346847 RepID=UPI00368149B2
MKRLLEILGLLALVQGVLALVQRCTGWGGGVVHRFLDGYEVFGGVVLIVFAFALFAAAESRKSG